MMQDQSSLDLVVLVADNDMKLGVEALLSRPPSLGIRPICHEVYAHPQKDPGCLGQCHCFLRNHIHRCAHALVLFDREGCGREGETCDALEQHVRHRLAQSGWGDRADAVVLDPELESWVWSDSPHVESALGWRGRGPGLHSWLVQEGWLTAGAHKPTRPKEAMEAALRLAGKPRSSAIFQQLAGSVSLDRCTDPAFGRFKAILQGWFPL